MKKGIICLLTVIFLGGVVYAEELKVGMKAPDWSFKDSEKKDFSMKTWEGKVLLINYNDPDAADMNEHFNEKVKKAKNEGRLKPETYKGIGIADCAATWKPDFLIRKIAGKKAKKYNTTILFDYDATLRNLWGLKKDSGNVVLLDKDRVCRAIIRGRVPEDQIETLIKLIEELQKK